MSSTPLAKRICLLSGEPGCGKTSAIKEALARSNRSAGGFFTEEIREGGVRQGFRIVTLDGGSGILAHTRRGGPHRVGRYGVDVGSIDAVAVPTVEAVPANPVDRKSVV